MSTCLCKVETFVKSSDEILEVDTGQVRSLRSLIILYQKIKYFFFLKISFLKSELQNNTFSQFYCSPFLNVLSAWARQEILWNLNCCTLYHYSCQTLWHVFQKLLLHVVRFFQFISFFFLFWKCLFSHTFPVLLVTLLFPWNFDEYKLLNQQAFLNRR